MELHSIFATAELRKEEHQRMLLAIERERSSRIVQYLRFQFHRFKLDAHGLKGARRMIRLDSFWHRRVRAR